MNNELIKINTNDNGEQLISGRELHEFLEIKTEYKNWIKRMIEYGFIEDQDYSLVKNDQAILGALVKTDHIMKIPMAKEISMLQRNTKGKQARQYFIKVEEAWNNPDMVIKRAMGILQRKCDALEGNLFEEKSKKHKIASSKGGNNKWKNQYKKERDELKEENNKLKSIVNKSPDITPRTYFSNLVKEYAFKYLNGKYQDGYNYFYKLYLDKYHIDIKKRAKNANIKPIELTERNNYLNNLINIVKEELIKKEIDNEL